MTYQDKEAFIEALKTTGRYLDAYDRAGIPQHVVTYARKKDRVFDTLCKNIRKAKRLDARTFDTAEFVRVYEQEFVTDYTTALRIIYGKDNVTRKLYNQFHYLFISDATFRERVEAIKQNKQTL